MVQINIRELMHHFSGYLKAVKKGEKILIMERNVPVAELIPYNPNLETPGWKRPIKRIVAKKGSTMETIKKLREEEWR